MLDIIRPASRPAPAPILYVGPNKQFLTEQFEPRVMALLDQAPSLMATLCAAKPMTKTRKAVAGVSVRLAHAGSSAALKSDPASLALVDEYDEMLANVKGQGDPFVLVERRGNAFADFVCAAVASTPKTGIVQAERDEQSGLEFWDLAPNENVRESPVWKLWQQDTRHHWAWPCSQRGEYFVPRVDRLRTPEDASPDDAPLQAHLECLHCHG